MQKILIVVESIDVEDSSGSKANVAFIKNLAKIGYDLQVYHYTRKEVNIEGVSCVAIKEIRSSLLFVLSRLERHIRYRLKIHLNKPLEKRFGFSFTLLNDRNSIIKGLSETASWGPDLVLTLSKGGSFRPHHALLKLPEFHDKWLAYIHDPYPMHFYPPPYPWYEPGYIQKEEFMKEVARKAKIIGFPSQLLMEWMGGKFQSYFTKGIVIPHQLEETSEGEEMIPEFFDSGLFNLVHAGNLLQGRDPNGLIEGFNEFLRRTPEAKNEARLIFLGGASYYSPEILKYQEAISQFIATEENLSFNLVQKIQKESTVNIILEAKSDISPFLPGKFPHCVMANRIILLLGPPKSEARRLLGSSYTFQAEIDDIGAISELITILYKKWKKDPNSLKINRPDLVKYLSPHHLKELMREVFEKGKRLDILPSIMNEKITILFAYRNRDLHRIKISMDSLANQTRKVFQVIFIDYGSSAEYSEPLQKLISSYSFARYFYVAHPGLLWNKSKAFNYGIQKTETDFILTADVDLIFNPDAIGLLENLVDASSFSLFNYGYLSQQTTAGLQKTTSFGDLKPSHLGNINGVGLFPLKALKQVHGFDEFFHFYGSEDEDLFERLENAGYPPRRDRQNLFLHQWHPRYPGVKETDLTLQPRLTNVLRINQQHYLRTIEYKKVVPFHQNEWGKCFFKDDFPVLQEPTLQFRISNLASSVVHFLNEHLPSCKGEILAIDFVEDAKFLSLKSQIKRMLGREEQPTLTLKEVNDMVLAKIVFLYRHYNYSYEVSEDRKRLSFAIDLRSGS